MTQASTEPVSLFFVLPSACLLFTEKEKTLKKSWDFVPMCIRMGGHEGHFRGGHEGHFRI